MTKYCPACESEFQDSVRTCPDDGNSLFNSPVSNLKRAELVDFYAASGQIEAELIVGILSNNGLTSRIFQRHISQFPTLTDQHFIISIKPSEKDEATELLRQAQTDKIVSSSGMFL